MSFQFPLENDNVGGFPDFKRDGVPTFRCCMLDDLSLSNHEPMSYEQLLKA